MEPSLLVRSLSIPNETRELRSVRAFAAEAVHRGGVPKAYENGILLAIDEAVANIITHAYQEGRKDVIEIVIEVDARRFSVIIRDSGTCFDPKTVSTPDLSAHVADGKRNGLGVFLMRRVMDEVEYLFKEGVRNELRMVKYLGT